MPCDSSYMEPTAYETKIKNTVEMLCYVYGWLNMDISEELINACDDLYFNENQGDKWVAELCSVLTNMSDDDRDRMVYARSRTARRLADWWEDHLEADIQRLRNMQIQAKTNKLKEAALDKLTADEKAVLGLTEDL